ncbi:MAG: acyl-CoA/acyl-ACP dehydrogenase [Methylibium sp.]|uniref:acyl-CoA dehydrogenase family protein n=1 Tax=Methylibium sp. TaxID=2067992 RepID=UPI00184026FF|nr:acyl-CoA dehydrogenase family protein [Methylibium sp.]MBA2722201.1 acyl-CoA/acyl-ACP dehydrogenase [Methylibium sp.]MBA3591062.1 acyl-CoA/acyl-ACP dehydrogenase [Methylibium sp.]
MNDLFSPELLDLRDQASAVAADVLLPTAEHTDATGEWPKAAMQALAKQRLTGLTVPKCLGGHGQGLVALAAVTEVLGQACAATAMCYGMHCVATAVIAAKSTAHHDARYLRPIAQGDHLTTLALSESGTGSNFFLPQTVLEREGNGYRLRGTKQFVTNGGAVDSYVVSTLASDASENGEFSCIVLDHDTPAMHWGEQWRGLGMRGNSSRSLKLDGAVAPLGNLLGDEGDQVWYVFEIVAPFFLTAMAATYLGVARAALDVTLAHLQARRHTHSGQSLSEIETVQHRVGQLWIGVERSRLLLLHAARAGDMGRDDAMTAILACKADAANTAVTTTNEAMTLCGGIAYRENSTLSRLLRDARASHVMSPTTDLLTIWTGRSALGLSLL